MGSIHGVIAFIQGMSPVVSLAWQHVNIFVSFEFIEENPNIDMEALAAHYADSLFWSSATQPVLRDLFE